MKNRELQYLSKDEQKVVDKYVKEGKKIKAGKKTRSISGVRG